MQDAQAPSHLFLVRLWSEMIEDDREQWRGKIKLVTSGETRYFVDWPDFVECIQSFLPDELDKGEKS
jgi:hypothetical protein